MISTLSSVLASMTPEGLPLWQYFFFVRTGLGWVYGTAGLTGDLLAIILIIMVLCSLPVVRRKGFFEVYGLNAERIIISFCLFTEYDLGFLLDPQPLYRVVHFVDSPCHTLLEVVLSPWPGLYC